MINSYSEMMEYYKKDIKMSGLDNKSRLHRLVDRRYKFYRELRRTEYMMNVWNRGFFTIFVKIQILRYRHLCDRYQWSIPLNVFGKGLSIVHVGTIVVSDQARIGDNCRLHVCTNIGKAIAHGVSGAPVIGNNVYIGPGAKIFGKITIGDNTVIGANAVVNSSFENGNETIAGVPARVISKNNSSVYICDK